jgi:catalase
LDLTAAGTKIHNEKKAEKEHMAFGILINRNSKDFINAIANHRFWEREKEGNVLA